MAGYIRSKAGSVNTTSATITGDASIGGDLSLGDNDKIILGAGSDLEIYHDGSASIIAESGAGDLRMLGNNLKLANADNSANYVHCTNGGAIQLNHNNAVMLQTNATGVALGATDATAVLRAGGTNTHLTLGAMGASGTVKLGSGGVSNGTIGATRMTVKANGDVTIENGNLNIGTTGKGIDFSATDDGAGTDNSSLLDDYEEGSWTPLFGDDSTSASGASQFSATYVRIGRLVTVSADITCGSYSGANANYMRGLPYTGAVSSTGNGGGGIGYTTTASIVPALHVTANTNAISFMNLGTSTGGETLAITGKRFIFSLTYETAQ